MLNHSLRRWYIIKPTVGRRLELASKVLDVYVADTTKNTCKTTVTTRRTFWQYGGILELLTMAGFPRRAACPPESHRTGLLRLRQLRSDHSALGRGRWSAGGVPTLLHSPPWRHQESLSSPGAGKPHQRAAAAETRCCQGKSGVKGQSGFNLFSAETVSYKPWRLKGFCNLKSS